MALKNSVMVPLGTPAPSFTLPDVHGGMVSLEQFQGKKGLLVVFMCNHCPYVKHVRDQLAEIGKEYQEQDLGMVGISANDVSSHPADSPEEMKKEAENAGYTFPYLYDESQEVAKAYHAICTPDFFLYDKDLKLAYRGQLDETRPNSEQTAHGKDLREAIDSVLAGLPVREPHKPSAGCNIKWKAGNEPEYA
jgi:peroxiredoxin